MRLSIFGGYVEKNSGVYEFTICHFCWSRKLTLLTQFESTYPLKNTLKIENRENTCLVAKSTPFAKGNAPHSTGMYRGPLCLHSNCIDISISIACQSCASQSAGHLDSGPFQLGIHRWEKSYTISDVQKPYQSPISGSRSQPAAASSKERGNPKAPWNMLKTIHSLVD